MEQGLNSVAIKKLIANMVLRNNEGLARATGGIGPDYDYSQIGALDSRGHGSDAGKLPWHPTFSDQSNYASAANPGGSWGQEINGDGKVVQTYVPSQESVENGNTVGLARYMQQSEPNVTLKTPVPYSRKVVK